MGSCFADSIGARLATNKVETLANPFGTVFQPLALGRLLRAAAGEDVDWQQHLVEARGRWQSYDLHGSIGADSPVELLQTIQELVRRTGDFLRQADVVLLTLGTAWAYRLRETGELVNNCHKQPADLFVRELLTPDELINDLAETHAYLRRINPELRFVVTVSPVRHLKDTLPMNSVSKSVLRLATHIVSDLLPGVAYFPAYELLLDDLRDYRFYASDMLHPSEVAEDYIWDKFARTYFDADFGRFRKEWAAVRQSLGHRPLHAGAPEHRQFLASTLEKLEQLSLRKVAVADELHEVRARLAALPMPRIPELAPVLESNEELVDIGGDSTTLSPAVDDAIISQPEGKQPQSAEGRPPRLSPEEFRAQRAARSGRPERGRRDGRGKGQSELAATENEQFQTASGVAKVEPENQPSYDAAAQVSPDLEGAELPVAPNTADLAMADGEELAKKKKRRSRGGAKRTARKHALRLAAEEGFITTEPGSGATAEADSPQESTEITGLQPANNTAEGGTQPEPTKRGGRRNGSGGRVPRVELFAAAPAPADVAPSLNVDAEEPDLPFALAEAPAILTGLGEPRAAGPDTRNNRNRNKRGGGRPAAEASVPDLANASLATDETASFAPIGTAEQLSGSNEPAARESGNRIDRGQPPVAAPLVAGATDATGIAGATPVAARRPNRSKSRAVSAARAEKPAIDTPVIPVPDVLQVRTQVAAGRMTGSSASLVAPTAPPKKVAAAKKPAVVPKAAVAPKVVVAKAKVVKAAVVPVAAAVASSPVKPAPTAKPKAAARPKAAVVKPVQPTTAAAPSPPARPKSVSNPKAATPKPASPKAATAKATEPKPAAPKPKALRKPAKPA
nr:GSCFA domain-containing protein [Hymenobacter terricola]